MTAALRVLIADDERPARAYLAALLRGMGDVNLVAEADSGAAAVSLIEQHRPDLAMLDLQMPEVDGLSVVGLVHRSALPLVAFVTAFDEYAVRAFELNAIDYLLKPVEAPRLRRTLARAVERLEHADVGATERERLRRAATVYGASSSDGFLRRIPVRQRDEIVIVPVDDIASVVADGELLHLTTARGARFTISHRLKDLEARLDPARFIRLSRGALANVDCIERISPLPGGTLVVRLRNRQELSVSRLRARALREQLLRL